MFANEEIDPSGSHHLRESSEDPGPRIRVQRDVVDLADELKMLTRQLHLAIDRP
jgi:hypothetical protein